MNKEAFMAGYYRGPATLEMDKEAIVGIAAKAGAKKAGSLLSKLKWPLALTGTAYLGGKAVSDTAKSFTDNPLIRGIGENILPIAGIAGGAYLLSKLIGKRKQPPPPPPPGYYPPQGGY